MSKDNNMELSQFLAKKPKWAQKPCLYIIEHPYGGVFRCGLSGSTQYADSDPVYGNESQLKGLLARVTMYHGFWYPFTNAKLIAALQVKSALVYETTDRVGNDFLGVNYNISRPTRTLVRTREKEFHKVLDQRGYRMKIEENEVTARELFRPLQNSQELIAALRMIKGEALYLMSSSEIVEDAAYRGGSRHMKGAITVHESSRRSVQDRQVKVPTLTIRMDKESIEKLRNANPETFKKLLAIMQSYDANTTTETVRMKKKDVEGMRDFVATPRRSMRLRKAK
jgi:hypothetical protein